MITVDRMLTEFEYAANYMNMKICNLLGLETKRQKNLNKKRKSRVTYKNKIDIDTEIGTGNETETGIGIGTEIISSCDTNTTMITKIDGISNSTSISTNSCNNSNIPRHRPGTPP